MFSWLWKRIRHWTCRKNRQKRYSLPARHLIRHRIQVCNKCDGLSCCDSDDSPSSERGSDQNHTAEATQSPEGFTNDIASNPADRTPDDLAHDESKQCRICYGQFSQVDALLSPCQCSGSLKYIHSSCLRKWIETRLNSGSTVSAATRCEICTGEFNNHNNQQGLKLEDVVLWISFDSESLELEIIWHLLLRTPSVSPSSSLLMYNFHYKRKRRMLIG